MILGIKDPFVRLQLLCIISGSHDASGFKKGQYGCTYYRRQHKNQATNMNYSRMSLFRENCFQDWPGGLYY